MVQHVYSFICMNATSQLGKESLSKTHTINNNDFLGSLVDSSLGSQVVRTGSLNSGLIDGDDGTVGVGHQAVAVSGTVGSNSSSGIESASKATSGSEVVSTGSSDSRLVSGDDSSIGVGHQVGVQVQGAGVAIADSRDSSDGGGDGGSSEGGSGDGDGSNGGVLGSPGGKVVNTGSSNSGLINGDNGSVGVANQVGVQVEGARVAVASSVDGRSRSVDWSSGDGRGSCVANTSISKSSTATTSSKVVRTGSGNCWLVHGDDGTVGVANQTVLGGGEGDTRGENQELHCCLQLCARAQTSM